MLRIAVFVIASLVLAYVSRASLRAPRSHGFPRFFAWLAILALILLQAPIWFRRPLAPLQLLSWALLALSAALAIHGFYLLRLMGRPKNERQDGALIGMEKTTNLVTAGAYRFIRHPLYSSLLFLAWGAFCKGPGLAAGALALLATGSLIATARVEEQENLHYFGAAYADYMRRTKMFIPFMW